MISHGRYIAFPNGRGRNSAKFVRRYPEADRGTAAAAGELDCVTCSCVMHSSQIYRRGVSSSSKYRDLSGRDGPQARRGARLSASKKVSADRGMSVHSPFLLTRLVHLVRWRNQMENWSYKRNGAVAGPVSKDELKSLYDAGEITRQTLVRSSSSGGGWRRYGDVADLQPPAPRHEFRVRSKTSGHGSYSGRP